MDSDKQKDYGRLFELFGCELQRNGSNNAQATECPFCGKSKFSVNVKTGQYQCFSKNTCGKTGNAYRWID
ncbi:MAG: hypothetical protein ACLQNE_16525 [Thermoguttaceae bacterium]